MPETLRPKIEGAEDFSFGEEMLEDEEGGLDFEVEQTPVAEVKPEKPKTSSKELGASSRSLERSYDLESSSRKDDLQKLFETYKTQNFDVSPEEQQKIKEAVGLYMSHESELGRYFAEEMDKKGVPINPDIKKKFTIGAGVGESLDEQTLAQTISSRGLNPELANNVLKWNLDNKNIAVAAVAAYPQTTLETISARANEEFYKDLLDTSLRQSPESMLFVNLKENNTIREAAMNLAKDPAWVEKVIKTDELEQVYDAANPSERQGLKGQIDALIEQKSKESNKAFAQKDFAKTSKLKKEIETFRKSKKTLEDIDRLADVRQSMAG